MTTTDPATNPRPRILEGKVAIITGAGSGFGQATAELFADNGARVVVVDIAAEAAERVVATITEAGGEALALTADVTDEDAIRAVIATTIERFGRLDVLFNNAGVYVDGDVEATSNSGWERSLSVNLTGIFYACKHALPHLKEAGGSIINTASAGGIIGFPGAIAYATTKGGVLSMTRALAVDHAKDGVRANAIAPGTGETGMTAELLKDEKIRDAFTSPIPLHRLGRPQDVAGVALFLASDFASYVTGATIPVDGGWTMS